MPKVLFLTAYPVDDASCRYRVHQFLPYLGQAGYECTVSSFCSPRLFRALKHSGQMRVKLFETLRCSVQRFLQIRDLARFDLAVIHREAFPFFAPRIESAVFSRHQRVIFSFDDAIYAGHPDVSTLNHPTLYRWKHGRKYDDVLRRSTHVIAGNRILAEYASQYNPRISVVPTTVDCERYTVRPTDVDQSRTLTIGWMGSSSTAPYLKIVEPALRQLANTCTGAVQFRFVGDPAYSPDLPYSSSSPFRLETETEDLHSMDIGLMPMPDTEWARGKCAFKAIQYMASGIPVVASPVGITCDLIQDGSNGLLATTPEQWFTQLKRLLNNPEFRARIALAGRTTIEESYSLKKWAPRMISIFDEVLGTERTSSIESVAA